MENIKAIQQNLEITNRLLSYTMNIFDSRLCEIVQIIILSQTTQLHMEKHRQKYRPLYIAFLSLNKAFDHAPHKVIRERLVLEKLVPSVKLL